MAKYIDADKLKMFEEMLADIIVSSQGLCTYEACKDRAKIEAPVLIDSLQQEQPEVDLKKEIDCFLSNATMMNKGEWKGRYPISKMGFGVVARYFFNLGLNARLNAREED